MPAHRSVSVATHTMGTHNGTMGSHTAIVGCRGTSVRPYRASVGPCNAGAIHMMRLMYVSTVFALPPA